MTTPTGKLAWGQAGNYDAVDDRAVIAAVTRGRAGLVWPVRAEAGPGLQVIIRSGWVGVTRCDDLTSAVVGSREDTVVMANPGAATDSRQDVVWCSTQPDEGTWELTVMPRAATVALTGIPLATISVPPGANLASQMDIRSVDASLERRLMSHTFLPAGGGPDYQATSWNGAVNQRLDSDPVLMEPGQWYRVRYDATCVSAVNTQVQLEARIAVGYRTEGQAPLMSQLARSAVFRWIQLAIPSNEAVEWVFRHALYDQPVWRVFDGRIWTIPTGGSQWIRPGGYVDGGYVQSVSVEDIGS